MPFNSKSIPPFPSLPLAPHTGQKDVQQQELSFRQYLSPFPSLPFAFPKYKVSFNLSPITLFFSHTGQSDVQQQELSPFSISPSYPTHRTKYVQQQKLSFQLYLSPFPSLPFDLPKYKVSFNLSPFPSLPFAHTQHSVTFNRKNFPFINAFPPFLSLSPTPRTK